jgi:hypothetical protein
MKMSPDVNFIDIWWTAARKKCYIITCFSNFNRSLAIFNVIFFWIVLAQTNGNMVLYNADQTSTYWSSSTGGNSGASLTLQDDGNLVLYSTSGTRLWSTNTAGSCSGKVLPPSWTLAVPNLLLPNLGCFFQ